jgi:Ca-activated chloride channel family protein
MRRKLIVAAALLVAAGLPFPAALFPINIRLSQIDASRLLLAQRVRLYVSVTDDRGQPLDSLRAEDFSVFESPDGERFTRIPRLEQFRPQAGIAEGVNFLLVLDNSGSMYDTLAGNPTEDPERMRITHARDAVRSFLSSMTDPKDTVGLVSYNTFYTLQAVPSRDRAQVGAALDTIRRPERAEAYTELYYSLTRAVREFEGLGGRKAVVILSDGENYPYAVHSGQPHPELGQRIVDYTEPIQACQEEAISVYAINFGAVKDPNLESIAIETGGTVFDARDRRELESVYRTIHEQVAGEYLLAYRATMAPAERKYVRVVVQPTGETGAGAELSATRFYFASTVFGLPLPALSLLLLIPLAAAALLLWLLTTLRLERRKGPAALEVLQTRVGRASTRVLPLSSAKTVIGGGRSADLTIVGAPGLKEQHATVIYDKQKRAYTVVSSGEVRVNNQPVKTRVLEPGDVIDVGGATIVFDDGEV